MTNDTSSKSSASPKSTTTARAGVDRAYDRSWPQKLTFYFIHTLSLGLCLYLVSGGIETVSALWGGAWLVVNPLRAWLLFGATALYWARHGLTLFYLLVRKVTWSEALGLAFFMLFIELGLCLLGCGITQASAAPVGPIEVFAVFLLLLGSLLNSLSELQRKWWKAHPENKGHCYTGGLFGLATHINYSGDVVMFSGWALLSATWWTLVLPLAMAAGFVFVHIPGLDAYLSERYGEEFRSYAARTKKLVPFLY